MKQPKKGNGSINSIVINTTEYFVTIKENKEDLHVIKQRFPKYIFLGKKKVLEKHI